MYFHMLSNMLYLIRQENVNFVFFHPPRKERRDFLQIYVSNNYGEKFIRIWRNDFSTINWTIHNPIALTDSGHLAFIYQTSESTSSFRYFAVLSKAGRDKTIFQFFCERRIPAGLYYTWRTQLLRSSIPIDRPFFFDSTGSFYFNTTPPLLIILATEQSLVATKNVTAFSHQVWRWIWFLVTRKFTSWSIFYSRDRSRSFIYLLFVHKMG